MFLSLFIFLVSNISICNAIFKIDKYFAGDLTCSNVNTMWHITQPGSCTALPSCENVNSMTGRIVACENTLTLPSEWASIEIWGSSTSCASTSDAILATPGRNTCSGVWIGASFVLNCLAQQSSFIDCLSTAQTCGGCSSKPATRGGACITGNPTSSFTVASYKLVCPVLSSTTTTPSQTSSTTTPASNTCFHESTQITYKDKPYKMQDFINAKIEPIASECYIPHQVRTIGVKVSILCNLNSYHVLRLTKEHLVFTSEGLKPAKSLIKGDIVFNDIITHTGYKCHVIETTDDLHLSNYFGLNCIESIVLANGIKTSTFGHYHHFPSFWMTYVSKIIGIKYASIIGDFIVSNVY